MFQCVSKPGEKKEGNSKQSKEGGNSGSIDMKS